MISRGLFFIFFAANTLLQAQVLQDTARKNIIDKIQNSETSKALFKALKHTPPDTLFHIKSEDLFMPHSGKIIRHIIINHIGFDKTMYDTTRSVRNTVTRIGNALHETTKARIIRDNLFVAEGNSLNPYELADNERYLRDLDFILDAKITIKRVRRDSVDLVITTRDVFSLGGSFNLYSASKYKFSVYDENLAGLGQRVQFNGLVENDRSPKFGTEFIYSKNSVGGSLINLSTGYTTLNSGLSYGNENEYALYFRLDRPLVSAYSRFAGALELSKNWSQNVFGSEDLLFRKYAYTIDDFWIGYNIGIHNKVKNRNRHFVSVRTFHQKFSEQPSQISEKLNPIFNNKTYVLGQFTFFNQNFYKTRYIYGFGRTEDVPYGRTFSLLAGWVSQLNLNRLYFGADFDRSIVHRSGDFYQYSFRAETFNYKNQLQDVSLLASASIYSRLRAYKYLKVRQSLRVDYATILKPTINQLMMINNDFGVRGFRADSLKGTQRLGFHTETVMFTNWKLLGFHFAPIVFTDFAFLSKEHQHIFYDQPYYGLGAGMRTRNENLVFGTIEFKGTYYPRIVENGARFKLSLRTNLRIKYTGTLVKPPAFIKYN